MGVPITIAPERREEILPGLDPELLALIQATAEVELKQRRQPSSQMIGNALSAPEIVPTHVVAEVAA